MAIGQTGSSSDRDVVTDLVSVVIPTHNRPVELARAVRCVLAQTGVELEVIVADDAGSEPAQAVVDSLGDDRVRAVRRAVNGGPAAARNTALAEAKGDWVAFLDDDDEWLPGKLAAQLDAMHATGAQWAWCAVTVTRADGSRTEDAAPPAEEIGELLLLHNAVPAAASNVIARTDLVREVGGFYERLPHMSDWDLWLRLAAVAPAASCPETLVIYREHEGGYHMLADEELREFALLRGRHPEVNGRLFTRWVARSHWQAGRHLRALATELRGRFRYRSRHRATRRG